MTTLLVRPITDWPGLETLPTQRRNSPFNTRWGKVMQMLQRELGHLRARDPILEIDVRPQDLRNDGGLRANARPQGPRVIVSAETQHGAIRMPCDTFRNHEANTYAIALTLEKLRAIDRYGVTMRGEQYRGWTAIPATTSATTEVEAAWRLLADEVDRDEIYTIVPEPTERSRETLHQYYREAAMRAHPDAGGTDERMAAVNRARETIARSFV